MSTVKLSKQVTYPPSYAVIVDGTKAGEVFKVQNGMYASFVWLPYPAGSDYPLEAQWTRREAVEQIVKGSWETPRESIPDHVLDDPTRFEPMEGLIVIPNGYRVQETPEYIVEVIRMLFNWRIVLSLPEHHGETYEHGYCYFGTGPDTLVIALAAARAWTEPFTTDPIGFDKKAF